ncbi:esterase family protein [Deminuibacter soli]|uniref:Esterase family protein n=2 Tax=Deminuibacter soli TaxID=2291815 RepID=A0A3E1NGY4_9BACT|nr:esterase family protein [Deminuibacter soli]
MLPLLVFVLLLQTAHAQYAQGKIIETQSVQSSILHRPVKYVVYLPPGYESSDRTFPVVYLLHGFSDDHTGWLQFGEINRFADKAIADGTIPPMIIVMPNGDSSFYINAYDGKENYEDFFVKEFMPSIEKTYRIKAEKKYRGVAGLSMGGYGTLVYALKYPELFAAAAPFSAAVWDDQAALDVPDSNWNFIFGKLYGRDLKGKARLTDAWYKNSPLKIVDEKSTAELSKVRYWIDCGDDDFLTIGNSQLHIALTKKHVPHEFRMRNGAHNWTYWRTGITDALEFIGWSFRQQ